MTENVQFDPGLFTAWPERPVYDGRLAEMADAADSGRLWMQARRAVLETKSLDAPAGADLRRLLNDMTTEMRAQFDYFRALRSAAEECGGAEGDEAAAKLARADVKAATDAMSLIVRTLEKIDTLQRQLSRDRELEAERNVDGEGLADARAHFLGLVDQRAEEGASALFERFKRDWLAARAPPGEADAGAEPRDATQDGGG